MDCHANVTSHVHLEFFVLHATSRLGPALVVLVASAARQASCKSVLGLGVSIVCGLRPELSSETLGIGAWGKERQSLKQLSNACFYLTEP